ncbi:MAG TPA: MBL fold metallo-hydrolase [Myxococcota bacterium]|nr:MBL fold metallo-hydrolase [Myxococcota bacterium]
MRHEVDIGILGVRMSHTRRLLRVTIIVAVFLAASFGAFLVLFGRSPLPQPPPLTEPMPFAAPPLGMAVFQLPTGMTHRSAAFAYQGGSFFDKRDFAMTAVLVKHPRGDLLIDTGFGRDIDAQLRLMPAAFRAITSYERGTSAADQLDAKGYDRHALRSIVLTHAHWDHVSGVPDFPGTRVWVTPEEHHFIVDDGALSAVARSFTSTQYEEYGFEGGRYLAFSRSHDVYGDGSIVIVPAPGHTPGSVIIFLALPTGERYALVGDLVWQLEGITERLERPWLTRWLTETDPSAVRENILRMSAIAARFPELIIVPAHDARGFAQMPRL